MKDLHPMNKISELELTKMQLSKERALRLQAEIQNTRILLRQLDMQQQAHQVQSQEFFDALKKAYALENGDEIAEDGSIKRAPVRSLKEA